MDLPEFTTGNIVPISLPDPADVERARLRRMKAEAGREAVRTADAVLRAGELHAANLTGHEQGHQAGYAQGWHSGLWCGAVAGALAALCGVVGVVVLRAHGVMW